jgi:predicted nucleotidyltransferase
VSRTAELRSVAQQVADGLPPAVTDVVLTGSVSRGVADDVSDIEMLVLSEELPSFDASVARAAAAGLANVDTWVRTDRPARHLGGVFAGVAIELVWWSRPHAEERVRALAAGELLEGLATADALLHGVSLRGGELLRSWQERLRAYPPQLTRALVEDATLMWRGYQPEGMLTLLRPGERVPLVERLVDDARRVARIVYALNRVWEPSLKRLSLRFEPLAVKPPRLADRLALALTETDGRAAVRTMYELAADTLALVPAEIDVARSRAWVAAVLEVVR